MIALVLGWITLRMSGHYLPLATMAWGLSLYYLLGNIDALGKYDGIIGVPTITIFGIPLDSGRRFFYLLWGVVMLASVAVIHLLDSRAGRALRAVKGGSTMAEAMGIDTLRVKVGAFVLAALLAATSGGLFAHFQRTVNPPLRGSSARGTTLVVAPGVHWIRMPLTFKLDHINLWAIDEGDGWTVAIPACAPAAPRPHGASRAPPPTTRRR